MKVQDISTFRKKFKALRKGQDNEFNDSDFIGNQYNEITGFLGMYHGHKPNPLGYLRTTIGMAEDDQGVYEFIQNAADAVATHFYMFYDEENLLVLNNGEKFERDGIISILNVGQSEGKENCDKIGRFGVGFKLVHRLVGKNTGLTELFDELKGPQLLSWNKADTLKNFANAEEIEGVNDSGLPWYFKIIITNFPAGVNETVKGFDFEDITPFEKNEFLQFQAFLRKNLKYISLDDFNEGSAFYLRLGRGKFNNLKEDENKLKKEVRQTLHYLKNLKWIQLNDQILEKDNKYFLDRPTIIQPRTEAHYLLELEEEKDLRCPVNIQCGFYPLEEFIKDKTLKNRVTKEVNYYKHFPIGEEKSGLSFTIHCNAFDIGSQRRNLHKSNINKQLFKHIVEEWISRMEISKNDNPKLFDDYYTQILISTPSESGSWQIESLYIPLLEYARENSPTSSNEYISYKKLVIDNTGLSVPIHEYIENKYWLKWNNDTNNPLVAEARNSAKLNLSSWTILDVVDNTIENESSTLDAWIESLNEVDYNSFLNKLRVSLDPKSLTDDQDTFKTRKYLKFIRYQSKSEKLKHISIQDVVDNYSKHEKFINWSEKYKNVGFINISSMESILVDSLKTDPSQDVDELLSVLSRKEYKRLVLKKVDSIDLAFKEDYTPKKKTIKRVKLLGELFNGWENDDKIEIRNKINLIYTNKKIPLSSATSNTHVILKNPNNHKIKFPIEELIDNNSMSLGAKLISRLKSKINEETIDKHTLKEINDEIIAGLNGANENDLIENVYKKLSEESENVIQNFYQFGFVLLYAYENNWSKYLDDWSIKKPNTDDHYDFASIWYSNSLSYIAEDYTLPETLLPILRFIKLNDELPFLFGNLLIAKKPGVTKENELNLEGIKDELDDNEFKRVINLLYSIYKVKRTRSHIEDLEVDDVAFLGVNEDAIFIKSTLRGSFERAPKRAIHWLDGDSNKSEFLTSIGFMTDLHPLVIIRKALLDPSKDYDFSKFPNIDSYQPFENIIKWLHERGDIEHLVKTPSQQTLIRKVCEYAKEEIKITLTDEISSNIEEWDDAAYKDWISKNYPDWSIVLYPGKIIAQHGLDKSLFEEEVLLFISSMDIFVNEQEKAVYVNSENDIKHTLFMCLRRDGCSLPFTDADLLELFANKSFEEESHDVKEIEPEKEQLEGKIERLKKNLTGKSKLQQFDLKWLLELLEWEYYQSINRLKKLTYINFKDVLFENNIFILRLPNIDEIPEELFYYQDHSHDLKLEFGVRGRNYKEIRSFEIVKIEELEVHIKVTSTTPQIESKVTARIGLPQDNFLMKNLLNRWNEFTEVLNKNEELIELIQNSLDEDKLGFIFGPPGTGKTTYLSNLMVKSFLEDENNPHVLILTPTNNAADILYKKVIETINEVHYDISDAEITKLKSRILRFSSDNKQIELSNDTSCIVITTVHRYSYDSFTNRTPIRLHEWSQIAFDEASMLPLPYILLPILEHGKRLNKYIGIADGLDHSVKIVGDPFQLMPVGLTPSLKDLIFTNSKIKGYTTTNIFWLFGIDSFELDTTNGDMNYTIEKLDVNYRSNESIVNLFGRFKYITSSGKLLIKPSVMESPKIKFCKKMLPPINIWHFDCDLPKKDSPNDVHAIYRYGYSAYHLYSAILAVKSAIELAKSNPDISISVITPYSKQTKICHELLTKTNERLRIENKLPIKVSTIHRFQGDESDVVLFILNPAPSQKRNKYQEGGLICGGLSHFNNHNLLNVAISRPKQCLICLVPDYDLIDRAGFSEYVFGDIILSNLSETEYLNSKANKIEGVLGDDRISSQIHVEQIRDFDVYRKKDKDLEHIVFLVGDKNLTMIIQKDLSSIG